MAKDNNDSMFELLQMMEKQTLHENKKPGRENAKDALMRVIDATAEKVEDIIDTWKDQIQDPLQCDQHSIDECLGKPEILKNALLSTFAHIKEIKELIDRERDNSKKLKSKNISKSSFVSTAEIYSSESEFEAETEKATEKEKAAVTQCDLSLEEENGDKVLEDENFTVDSRAATDCLNNVADETVYEDCTEEVGSETEAKEEKDGTYNEEDETVDSESESEDDPSWMVSDEESSGSDYEEEIRRPSPKKMPKVNFKTANVKSMGMWLSDTGPVCLNTMCHCKGMCVKNCACRAAGTSCTVRCGCKVDKCKFRRKPIIEEDIFDDDGFITQAKLRSKRPVLGEINTNKLFQKPLLTPLKMMDKDEEPEVFSTPAPIIKPPKFKPDVTPPSFNTDVFVTPACRPLQLSSDSSILTSTAKKRNKKKLFTDSIGPQEL